jgi:hypothetical protein
MSRSFFSALVFVTIVMTSVSFAYDTSAPKDAKEALEREHKERLDNAQKFNDAVSEALNDPIKPSTDFEAQQQRVEYTCVRDTGGTWLERFGIHCFRCAWYIVSGNCTFQPGDTCISERISDYQYTCRWVPETATVFQ